MATDSTELTFVRCPSCRSLVPAVSSRCRMCGSALEAVSRSGAEQPKNDSTFRVRQKTVSNAAQSAEKTDAPEAQSVSAASKNVAAPEAIPAVQAHANPPIDDPLSAYIEEVDIFEASNSEVESSVKGVAGESNQQEVVKLEDEIEEEALASEFEVVAKPSTESEEVASPAAFDESDDWPDEASEVEFQVAPPKAATAAPITNGNGQHAHKAHPQQSTPQQKFARADSGHSARGGAPVAGRPANKSEANQQQFSRAPSTAPLGKSVEQKKTEEQVQVAVSEPVVEPIKSYKQLERKMEHKNKINKSEQGGRLVGWLVSFSDDTGQAIELREGKFFVTSASIRDNDLVLDDNSVSSPHAMVAVSLSAGLVVQDLMSDQGVHVKRAGHKSYQPEEDVVSVEHGDWVRFGMVEFLVTLVPELAYAD